MRWIHSRGAKTTVTAARVWRGLHGKGAVVLFPEGVHGQGGACDVAALGFERGRGGTTPRPGRSSNAAAMLQPRWEREKQPIHHINMMYN
jgi:hypothetical protein